jgi:hypothetical protein
LGRPAPGDPSLQKGNIEKMIDPSNFSRELRSQRSFIEMRREMNLRDE